MKVLAINTSPRKGRNTEQLLNEVIRGCHSIGEHVEVEMVHVSDADESNFKMCRGCWACKKTGNCKFSRKHLAYIRVPDIPYHKCRESYSKAVFIKVFNKGIGEKAALFKHITDEDCYKCRSNSINAEDKIFQNKISLKYSLYDILLLF